MEQSKTKETAAKYPTPENYVEQAKLIVATVNNLQALISAHIRRSEFPDKTRNQCLGQVYGLISRLMNETA